MLSLQNLSENHLGVVSAQMLSDILQTTTSLTHVTLSENDFDDRAAIYFAEAIMVNLICFIQYV